MMLLKAVAFIRTPKVHKKTNNEKCNWYAKKKKNVGKKVLNQWYERLSVSGNALFEGENTLFFWEL